jgi:hypothetical protein
MYIKRLVAKLLRECRVPLHSFAKNLNDDTRARDHTNGQAVAEIVVVLWVFLILIVLPFIDLVTFSLRYNFLLMASRDAAFAASRARTFQSNVSSSQLSAVNAASAAAQGTAAAFNKVSINSVNTYIVITRLSDGYQTRQNTKLTNPADTSNYAYQIETVLNGSTNPIITMPQGYPAAIPGLTAPINVSIASRSFAENPQGLNQ